MKTTAAVLALTLAAGGAAAQNVGPMKVGETRVGGVNVPLISVYPPVDTRLIVTDNIVSGRVGDLPVFVTTVGNVTLGRVGDRRITILDFRVGTDVLPEVVSPPLTTVIGSHQWAMDYLMQPVGDN